METRREAQSSPAVGINAAGIHQLDSEATRSQVNAISLSPSLVVNFSVTAEALAMK
jgi:hypothetical protein